MALPNNLENPIEFVEMEVDKNGMARWKCVGPVSAHR